MLIFIFGSIRLNTTEYVNGNYRLYLEIIYIISFLLFQIRGNVKMYLSVCRYEFFYGELLAAGSHSWLPAPLERNLADAWTKVTA